MTLKDFLNYLKDPNLLTMAREVRERACGNYCEIRSVFEIANKCVQDCHYCAMANSSKIMRFEASIQEIERVISTSEPRSTLMLQSGQGLKNIDQLCEVIAKYPQKHITVSFGNLSDQQYIMLREVGVKRYVLKFETSDPILHQRFRPADSFENRLKNIRKLIELGFQVSTGIIVGLPGQSVESIYHDLKLMEQLGCNLLSASPFIANEDSRLKDAPDCSIDLILKVLAIMRIMKPNAVIPAVSALNIIADRGQLMGLNAGANAITLHDASVHKYDKLFKIYSCKKRSFPQKDVINELSTIGLIPSYEALV